MSRPADNPLAILQAKVGALRLANAALEKRMPAEAGHLDSMLSEVESQRNSLRAADGSYRSYPFEAAVLHSPQGKQEGAVVSATDITELRVQEGRLRHNESLLKEAQQQAHMGSWELDLARKKLSWSEQAYRIFEIDMAVESDPYHDFFAAILPVDRKLANHACADSLRRHKPLDVVHRLLMRDPLRRHHDRHHPAQDGRRRNQEPRLL